MDSKKVKAEAKDLIGACGRAAGQALKMLFGIGNHSGEKGTASDSGSAGKKDAAARLEDTDRQGSIRKAKEAVRPSSAVKAGETGKAGNAVKAEGRRLLAGLLWGIFAFFTGGAVIALGAAPMGYALLCSLTPHVPFIYIGLMLSAVFGKTSALSSALILTAAFLLRCLLPFLLAGKKEKEKAKPFSEPTLFRYTAAILCAFAAGMTRLIAGGFLFYDLFGLLFSLSAVPCCLLLYDFVFDTSRRFSMQHELGQMALLLSLTWGLHGYSVAGFSLSTCAAFFFTLYVSKTGGILRGGIAGFLCGLVCRPTYAPVMGLAGLVSGLLWNVSTVVAVACACAVGVSLGIYTDGFPAVSVLAPDLLGISAVFLPLAQFGLLPKLLIYSNRTDMPEQQMTAGVIAEEREKAHALKLEALTNAMKSLSEVFYNLSDRLRRPGIYELRQLTETCYQTHCTHCGLNTVCWVREHAQTADAMNRMTAAIHKNGILTHADVPSVLAERCRNTDQIVSDINCAHVAKLEEGSCRDKLEVIALDYEAMAKLLTDSQRLNREEGEQDPVLTKKIRRSAKYLNFSAASMSVYGKRKLTVIAGGVDLSRVQLSPEQLCQTFGRVLGVRFHTPRFDVDQDYITMTMTAARRFSVECARTGCCKEDEKINGDSIAVFENKEDYYYTLLSDGMGSGRDAALTSRMCSVFLETMLSAGNPKGVVLQMLNNFIRNKNLECFATVDLLEIDLLSGRAVFIKSGAAPSYILRDGKLFKISSNTMPVGITREMNAEEIRFDLEPEDIIVMVSDGVAQCFEDSIWLANMLSFDWKENDTLFSMSEKILAAAKSNNDRSDDMTVAMLRVKDLP